MRIDAAWLAFFAGSARTTLENYALSESDVTFDEFPRGACGAASELLGRYLGEAYELHGSYVSGLRSDGATHAWLKVDGIILDITADQFAQSPVIVTRYSPWHAEWDFGESAAPDVFKTDWSAHLDEAWRALVSGLTAIDFLPPRNDYGPSGI